jgi:hypothetical protein
MKRPLSEGAFLYEGVTDDMFMPKTRYLRETAVIPPVCPPRSFNQLWKENAMGTANSYMANVIIPLRHLQAFPRFFHVLYAFLRQKQYILRVWSSAAYKILFSLFEGGHDFF